MIRHRLVPLFVMLMLMLETLTACSISADKSQDKSRSTRNSTEAVNKDDINAEADESEYLGSSESTPETTGMSEEAEGTLNENQIRIIVGNRSFTVTLENNESTQALRDLLADGDRTISASNYGGFEKVCQLGTTLPSNDKQTKTRAGDVMLYSSNQIVIFYGGNSWTYTRLGKVDDLSTDDLEQILSGSEKEITLSLK